jgi:two-component system, cell cycle sensor histidine kinase and response regulator CckA
VPLDMNRSEGREPDSEFRAIFDDAPDAMLIVDDERGVVEANAAAVALFGGGSRELRGRRLDDLLSGDGEALVAAWNELLARDEARREHKVTTPGGARHLECSYRARLRAGRHLFIARDVTHRHLLDERLVQSEKIESLGRLAGGVAHDFNNLLTAILGYTELLISSREPADPALTDLIEIQKAGKRAAALTQQLLAFSRKQVLMPKEIDLNQTVKDLSGMLTRVIREDIRLTCDTAPAPAVVRIDPSQIEQVILNLVLNARDAMPSGGQIRIEVATGQTPPPVLAGPAAGRADQFVRVRVADTGVGIQPEIRAHLFEPFFTTKEFGKGSGLGLASVYGSVRQSNGLISVESEPGLGTTFTMYFPAATMPVRQEPAAATDVGPARHDQTILIVEDEEAVRAIASAALRRRGYEVLESSSPREACELFSLHAPKIDLLLTDVVMPEMNGPALAQRLVARRPQLRVLFISGYADIGSSRFDSENPNIGFLNKPFQAWQLAEKVDEILNRPRRRSA